MPRASLSEPANSPTVPGIRQFAVIPAGTTTVTFSGLGVVIPVNADASVALTRVDITTVSTTRRDAPRCTVLVGGGRTGIKICDPNPSIPATDPPFLHNLI